MQQFHCNDFCHVQSRKILQMNFKTVQKNPIVLRGCSKENIRLWRIFKV